MIQDGNRAPLLPAMPPEAPEWFKQWMRDTYQDTTQEVRFIHNELESYLLPSSTVYPFALSWKKAAVTTAYCVFLSWDAGDATTALSLSAKTTTGITIAKVGTAPGNVSVLRIL